MVAGRHRLDHGRLAVREESGEQDGRLHLRGGDGKLVVDRLQLGGSFDDERRVAVRRLHRRAHPSQRLGNTLERALGERRVADELETAALAGEEPGQKAHERPRVSGVDGTLRLAQPPEAHAAHGQRVDVVLLDLRPERADRRDRRLRVARATEPRDPRLAVRDCAQEHGAMRDRLVAGHGDVPDEGSCRLDPHGLADRLAHERDERTDLVGEACELSDAELLRAVAERVLGLRVHLDHDAVGSDRDRRPCEREHESLRPAACDGSTITGRCVSRFNTGTAERSSV